MILAIEQQLKRYFQQPVQLTLRSKPYKKGTFINFRLSGCYLSIKLLTEKKTEIFEVPFPYAVYTDDGMTCLDYRFETLAEHDQELLVNLLTTTKKKNCKFYNTVLSIAPLK